MTDDEIINLYKPMVAFLADVLGRHCEVVLHDLRNYEKSIIAISNPISGRKIGGTVTDLALNLLKNRAYEGCDYVANYSGRISDKSLKIKAATFFIKDSHKRPIALLCINADLSEFKFVRDLMDRVLQGANEAGEESHSISSMTEVADGLIDETLNKYPNVATLKMKEKKAIVKELHDKGVFLIKGSVLIVAERLITSEQTIYRYLKPLTY